MWCSALGCIVTLALGILIAPLAIEAQSPGTVPRIGVLRHARQVDEPRQGRLEEFRHGLRELGYLEGQNILIEVRYTEEHHDRLAALAAELVRLKVDVIVTHGAGIRAAREATSSIPIVMARIDDADTHGYVASLAQPGGNITGLSFQTGELSGKWLELLKEAVPSLSRVAVLFTEGAENQRRTLEQAAPTLGIHLHSFTVRSVDDFSSAFAAVHTAQAEGLVMLGALLFTNHTPQLAALAAQHRLPAIYYHRRFAEAGGLMAYGPKESDPSWGWQRAAAYVHKILQGAKPAELPVERPMQFELVINLKTAKALGLMIPPSILFQATEVIR